MAPLEGMPPASGVTKARLPRCTAAGHAGAAQFQFENAEVMATAVSWGGEVQGD